MFSITSFLSLALAASSVVGFAIPVQHRSLHRRYYATNGDLLEPYDIYHARYLRLDCEDQHNTQFFTDCCHPFLKTQDESMLPATCVAPSSTGAAATATATDADVAAPTSTSGSGDDSSDDDGEYCTEGDDDCECDDDDSSTASATATADDSSATDSADDDSAPATATADDDSAPTSAPTDAAANAGGDPNGATVTDDATATVYSTAAAAAPTSSGSGDSGSDGQTFTDGVATFFYQNGVAGACGAVNPDTAVIAAMDSARYGNGELCGKQVHITNTANGKSVIVTVADECPTCNNADSIDLSTGAFDQIADEATGEVAISWYFMN